MNIYGLTFSALEKHITMRGQKSSKAPSAARFIYADPACGTGHIPEAGQRTKKTERQGCHCYVSNYNSFTTCNSIPKSTNSIFSTIYFKIYSIRSVAA